MRASQKNCVLREEKPWITNSVCTFPEPEWGKTNKVIFYPLQAATLIKNSHLATKVMTGTHFPFKTIAVCAKSQLHISAHIDNETMCDFIISDCCRSADLLGLSLLTLKPNRRLQIKVKGTWWNETGEQYSVGTTGQNLHFIYFSSH